MTAMIRPLSVLFALALTALVALATGPAEPAHAQQYQGCQATVSDVTVMGGQTITVTGSGADSGAGVTADLTTTIGRGTADANGNFSFPATIPADFAPGTYTLTVDCANGGVTEITITVGEPTPGTGTIPKTGSDSTIPTTKIGIGFVAAGGLVLAVSRRRRWASAGST